MKGLDNMRTKRLIEHGAILESIVIIIIINIKTQLHKVAVDKIPALLISESDSALFCDGVHNFVVIQRRKNT